MNLAGIHQLLAAAYFLTPAALFILIDPIKIQFIELKSEHILALLVALTVSFSVIFFAAALFNRTLSSRISLALQETTHTIDNKKLLILQLITTGGIAFYAFRLAIEIDITSTRDEKFVLLTEHLGPLFTLLFKVGLFSTALCILSKRYKPLVLTFVAGIALISLTTLSRSMLLIVATCLIPFLRLRTLHVVVTLTIIFLSRLILTSNFSLDMDWLLTFGFGEMVGVTFGPYAILDSGGIELSQTEQVGLFLHTIPLVSTVASYGLDVPELTILVNNFTMAHYGLYGVAGTAYLDLFLHPPLFAFLILSTGAFYFYLCFTKTTSVYFAVTSCAYIASAIATSQLYRWSFSGFFYSTARDTALFIIIYMLIKKSARNQQCSPLNTPQ